MRQLTRVICCTTAVLAMTACGASSASSASSASPRSGPRPAHPAVFPLTMTRTGGIAGFEDVVVVAGGGLVSVTRRGLKDRDCRLTPVAFKKVRTTANQVAWSRTTPDPFEPRFPDDLVVMVRSPAGGPLRLENPVLGAAGKVFQELVSDVLSGAAASSTCKAA